MEHPNQEGDTLSLCDGTAYECTGSMNHMDVRQAVVDACTFQQTTFMASGTFEVWCLLASLTF